MTTNTKTPPTDHARNFLLERLMPYWHSPSGIALISICCAVFLYVGVVVFRSGDFSDPNAIVPALLLAAVMVLVWFWEHRLPRVPKSKVGILLAITADDDAEAKRIQTDFTHELIRKLNSGRFSQSFVIITLPDFIVSELTQAMGDEALREKIRLLVHKTGAHFFLRGYSKRREISGKDYHLLRLDALVRHSRIPMPISKIFAQDISTYIPKEMQIAVDGDAIAFEATSAQIGYGARYTIGVAAAFSGALRYAEEILTELEQEISALQPIPDVLKGLKNDLPKRLIDIYRRMIMSLGESYHLRRSNAVLEQSEPICLKLLARHGNDYVAKLHLAMIHFVLRRDVAASKALLLSCKNPPDTTYRISLAFLLAYEGKLKEAHDEYRTAFHKHFLTASVPVQTEEFIQLVIQEEPAKSYLWFCNGLVNYNGKKDYVAARRDFIQFLECDAINSFPWAKAKAEELLKLCERYSEPSDSD